VGGLAGYNTTISWPSSPGALGEAGNSGMVSGCKATPGCIAYIGVSYLTSALQAGLGYAELQNQKGTYELPTATTIAAAAAGFVKTTPANGTISMIYGRQPPATDRELRVRHRLDQPGVLHHGHGHPLVARVGGQPEGREQLAVPIPGELRPLPTKVVAQSVTQILKIK